MRHVSPKLQQWLENYNRLVKELLDKGFKQTPTNAREGLARLTQGLVTKWPEIPWVQDDLVDAPHYSVPVRIYHPAPDSHLPVLIYYHGGGHMAGNVTVYDPICRKIALSSQHIVVSPDYRLAPECPYPAGVQDGYNVAERIWTTLDGRGLKYQRQLAIAGDSGGGAICATVAHMAQHDAGIDIRRQALIYPGLDYTMKSASMEENGTGYLLEKKKISWFFSNYFQNGENRREASPLYMDFTDKLPQTLMIIAEFCPLRDEGYAYMEKLKSTNVQVEHLYFNDMIHAFINMENLVQEECAAVYRKIGEFLNSE
ncbi:MAG: alpha/beta hydrolase [Deltaproteobacteria bacterium]|nr:alpha/beta hydrolase [Deltaproteobacteria bacterium]